VPLRRKAVRGRIALGKNNRLVRSIPRAPVTQIPVLNDNMKMDFFQSLPGCMGMTMRIKWGLVTSSAVGVSVVNTLSGNVTGGAIFLQLGNVFYWPLPYSTMINQFQQVWIEDMSLTYTPRVATSVSASILLGYCDDPEYLAKIGRIPASATLIEADFQGLSRAIEFPVYAPNSMSVHQPVPFKKDMMYTGIDNPGVVVNYASNSANLRQSSQGVWMVCATTNLANVTTTYGELWFTLRIHCCDIGLPQSTGLHSARQTEIDRSYAKRLRSLLNEEEGAFEPTDIKSKGDVPSAPTALPEQLLLAQITKSIDALGTKISEMELERSKERKRSKSTEP